jgi:ribA/ribD-fused uncharacterized protein
MESPINFYSATASFGVFSNFYPCKIVYRDKEYPTSEHAFQAAKFDYPGASQASLEYAELIRQEPSPAKIFFLAKQKDLSGLEWRVKLTETIRKYRTLGVVLRPNWDSLKVGIMKEILRVKFSLNGKLCNQLLETDGYPLVEHTSRDKFWGDGGNGMGKNMLGKLLMEVREELLQSGEVLVV